MRLTVRLSKDTLNGIKKLQQIYEDELNGLKINQGYAVYKAYMDTIDSDWVQVRNDTLKLQVLDINESIGSNKAAGRTTLDLNDEVLGAIREMQLKLPSKFGGKRITTGYCIKLIVKAALLKLEKTNLGTK